MTLASAATTMQGLDRRYELHPQVALRPEPFGALAYHYGNRRLIFLRHPDIVAVVAALADHDSVADTLAAHGIEASRWPSFVSALASLEASEVIRER
jgi:putative mycofactocin binding protein MftB